MAKKLSDFPARFAVSGTAALALILGDKQLLFAALCVRVVRDGQHQADAVFLVDFRRGKVVVCLLYTSFWLMGILDELKKLTHPYDDEDEEYEDFEEPRERSFDDRRNKAEDRRNKVVNIHATTQLKVVLVKPDLSLIHI